MRRDWAAVVLFGVVFAALIGGIAVYDWWTAAHPTPEVQTVIPNSGQFAKMPLGPLYAPYSGDIYSTSVSFDAGWGNTLAGAWASAGGPGSMFVVAQPDLGVFYSSFWAHTFAHYIYDDINTTSDQFRVNLAPGSYMIIFFDLTFVKVTVTVTQSIVDSPA